MLEWGPEERARPHDPVTLRTEFSWPEKESLFQMDPCAGQQPPQLQAWD